MPGTRPHVQSSFSSSSSSSASSAAVLRGTSGTSHRRSRNSQRGRRNSSSYSRRNDTLLRRVALGAAAFVIVLAPELYGGVFAWSTAVIAALSVVAAVASYLAYRRSSALADRSPVLIAFLCALGVTAIQAAPLPCAAVRAINPEAVDQYTRTRAAMGASQPSICTLSYDPGATQLELVKGAAIIASFFAAWLLAANRKRVYVLGAVAASVVLMAMVALAHVLAGADRVFGVHAPVHARPALLAPLMNGNHLAGFLALGAPLLAGFAFEERDRGLRAAWIAACILVVTTACLTLSRGGVAALVVGGLFFAVALKLRSSLHSSRTYAALALLGAVVLIIGLYMAGAPLLNEFRRGDLSKIDLIGKASGLVFEHPWLGVGRGAFSTAFAQAADARVRYSNPENLLVQWGSEWGIPLTVALLGALGIGLAHALRNARSVRVLGAISGLVAIVAHDFVDFSLEMSGVVVVAAALFGAVVAPRSERDEENVRGSRGLTVKRLAVPSLATVTAIVLVLGILVPRTDAFALQGRLESELASGDRRSFRQTLETAVAAHPGEPAFALLAGAEAARYADPAAPKWLNRAMELAPTWGSPHAIATQWLLAHGRFDQALLELRSTAARDPAIARALLCGLLARKPEASIVMRVAPNGPNRATLLNAGAECLRHRPEQAEIVDARILRESPGASAPRLRHAERILRAGKVGDALAEARAAARAAPEDVRAQITLARILLAHAPAEAVEVLGRIEPTVGDARVVLELRVRAAATSGNAAAVQEATDALLGAARGSPEALARATVIRGDAELQLGNDASALRAYEEAVRFNPTEQALLKVARLAERMGDRPRAYRAYARLVDLVPGSQRYRLAKAKFERSPEPWGGLPQP